MYYYVYMMYYIDLRSVKRKTKCFRVIFLCVDCEWRKFISLFVVSKTAKIVVCSVLILHVMNP